MSTPAGSGNVTFSAEAPGANTANAPVGGAYVPVRVDLVAEINIATQEVQIFTTPSTTLNNVVVCSQKLSASKLYSGGASKGVFEFTEPAEGRTDISGYVSNGSNGSVLNGIAMATPLESLASGLQTVLTNNQTDSLDAATAIPFAAYSAIESGTYSKYENLGELVLSLYASYLFGHPAATAGITNDIALRDYVNSAAAGANVGTNLATAINNLSVANATAIVKSVLSQDPKRASDGANRVFSAGTGATHVPLYFQADDVIYVSITVLAPTVASSNAGGSLGGIATNAATRYPSTAPKFAFEITLS
jgi:hypothetical protein